MTATEEERREVYFYTDGTAVLCRECATELLEIDPSAGERMRAQYTASRMYRCGSCYAIIGPINAEEAGRA